MPSIKNVFSCCFNSSASSVSSDADEQPGPATGSHPPTGNNGAGQSPRASDHSARARTHAQFEQQQIQPLCQALNDINPENNPEDIPQDIAALLRGRIDPAGRTESGDTPLGLAAKAGRAAIVRNMLDNKHVNPAQNPALQQLLHKLLSGEMPATPEVVNILAGHDKVDVNGRDDKDRTPLMAASESGNLAAVELLLNQNAINVTDETMGQTALHFAAEFGQDKIAEKLLEKEANIIDVQNRAGVTPLMEAAFRGHINVVELLLKRNANTDVTDNTEGETALHFAAKRGHDEIVEKLLKKNPGIIDAQSNPGLTPLMLAGFSQKRAVIKLLLERGANINAIDREFGATLLHFAAKSGLIETVRILLGKDPDINVNVDAITKKGQTPLHVAVEAGKFDVVELLLARKELGINEKDKMSQTALHLAAGFGHGKIAEELLKKGAKINAQANNGLTPLMFAGLTQKREVIKLLLERGASPNAITHKHGETLLHFAARAGHIETVRTLLENAPNIKVNAQSKEGHTPLHVAVEAGKFDVVELLLARKELDINKKNNMRQTALHLAAWFGHDEIAKELLNKGADINARDYIDSTPLMFAGLHQKHAVLKLLLERGAEINAARNDGATLLHIAARAGRIETVRTLLGNDPDINVNVNVNAKSEKSQTPLMVATFEGYFDIVKLLLARKELDINTANHNGETALHIAVSTENISNEQRPEFIARLIEHNIDPNKQENTGNTALSLAVTWEDQATIECLLAHRGTNPHAALSLLKRGEQECGALLENILGPRYIDKREELEKEWCTLSFEDKKIRVLEDWAGFREAEPENTEAAAQQAHERHRVRNTRRAGRTNFYLGKLLTEKEKTMRGEGRMDPADDECAKGAVFRLTLALEQLRHGNADLSEIQECAEELLKAAPHALSFNIGGVQVLKYEIEEIVHNQGLLVVDILNKHAMDRTQDAGWQANVHLGGFALRGQRLLDEMRKRNDETGGQGAPIKIDSGIITTLDGLLHTLPGIYAFPRLFPTEIPAEYREALWHFREEVAGFLRNPSDEELEKLAGKIHAKVSEIPLQDIINHYRRSRADARPSDDDDKLQAMIARRRTEEAVRETLSTMQRELDVPLGFGPTRSRAEIVQHKLDMIAAQPFQFPDELAFAPVFDTGMYAEYVSAFQKFQGKLADFLRSPSNEGLGELAHKIHTEVCLTSFDTVKNFYRGIDEVGVNAHTSDVEIERRRTEKEVGRILGNIKLELSVRPEIEAFIEQRIFESDDEAWASMPLTGQAQEFVNDLVSYDKQNTEAACKTLQKLLDGERLINTLAGRIVDDKQLASSREEAKEMLRKEPERVVAQLVEAKSFNHEQAQESLSALSDHEELITKFIKQDFFKGDTDARQSLQNMKEENWYWSREQLRDIDRSLRENPQYMGRTLRDLTREGLAHTFRQSLPVDDADLKTDTHTTLKTVWDYMQQRPQDLQNKLGKSFLAKLIEIGDDTPCNQGVAIRLLATPDRIDLSLCSDKEELDLDDDETLRSHMDDLRRVLPSLEDDLDTLLLAEEPDNPLRPQKLREKAGLPEEKVEALQKAETELRPIEKKMKQLQEDFNAKISPLRQWLLNLTTRLDQEGNNSLSREEGDGFMGEMQKLGQEIDALDARGDDRATDPVQIDLPEDFKQTLEDKLESLREKFSRGRKRLDEDLTAALRLLREKAQPLRAERDRLREDLENDTDTQKVRSTLEQQTRQMAVENLTALIQRRSLADKTKARAAARRVIGDA